MTRRLGRLLRLFLLGLSIGMASVLALAGYAAYQRHEKANNVLTHPLATGIDVAAQLPRNAIPALRERGYTMVIDLRPDGEAPDQTASQEFAAEAREAGLQFRYVPVPHGDISEAAVKQLRKALSEQQGPVLVYCRSGSRAARTWALTESERRGGLSADQILAAVQAAGQNASDLSPRIAAGVAARERP